MTHLTDQQIEFYCFGDIVGRAARSAIKAHVRGLREHSPEAFIIANGENACGGVGLDAGRARELLESGISLLTLGDHAWNRRDIVEVLQSDGFGARCIRPANFPPGAAGSGWSVVEASHGLRVGVANILGRVFIEAPLDCPFRTADALLDGPLKDCDITVFDFHAEATSEKVAFGRYLNGRASVVFGTHTHIPTADEQILDKGTAYISDVGMCGPRDSIIGMDTDTATNRFLYGTSKGYRLGGGPILLQGIRCLVERGSGVCSWIERVREVVSL